MPMAAGSRRLHESRRAERNMNMEGAPAGFIHVYTGDGRGKTTAALGLALRAAGAGVKTFIVQLMKDYAYSELKSLQRLKPWIELEHFGSDGFVFRRQPPGQEDLDAARRALACGRQAMVSGRYGLVIFDEICVAIYFGLLSVPDVLSLLAEKPAAVELVLTGRYCPAEIIERADLVSDIREVKHYYQQGIIARKGFDC